MQSMFSDQDRIKSEINNGKIIWKISKQLELNNALINNPEVKGEITKAIRKYFVMNEKENPMYQKSGMHLNHCLEGASQHQIFVRKEEGHWCRNPVHASSETRTTGVSRGTWGGGGQVAGLAQAARGCHHRVDTALGRRGPHAARPRSTASRPPGA